MNYSYSIPVNKSQDPEQNKSPHGLYWEHEQLG